MTTKLEIAVLQIVENRNSYHTKTNMFLTMAAHKASY
jgi:hypothetical protein